MMKDCKKRIFSTKHKLKQELNDAWQPVPRELEADVLASTEEEFHRHRRNSMKDVRRKLTDLQREAIEEFRKTIEEFTSAENTGDRGSKRRFSEVRPSSSSSSTYEQIVVDYVNSSKIRDPSPPRSRKRVRDPSPDVVNSPSKTNTTQPSTPTNTLKKTRQNDTASPQMVASSSSPSDMSISPLSSCAPVMPFPSTPLDTFALVPPPLPDALPPPLPSGKLTGSSSCARHPSTSTTTTNFSQQIDRFVANPEGVPISEDEAAFLALGPGFAVTNTKVEKAEMYADVHCFIRSFKWAHLNIGREQFEAIALADPEVRAEKLAEKERKANKPIQGKDLPKTFRRPMSWPKSEF